LLSEESATEPIVQSIIVLVTAPLDAIEALAAEALDHAILIKSFHPLEPELDVAKELAAIVPELVSASKAVHTVKLGEAVIHLAFQLSANFFC